MRQYQYIEKSKMESKDWVHTKERLTGVVGSNMEK